MQIPFDDFWICWGIFLGRGRKPVISSHKHHGLSPLNQTLRKPVVLRSVLLLLRPSAKFTCPYLGISRGDSPVVLMRKKLCLGTLTRESEKNRHVDMSTCRHVDMSTCEKKKIIIIIIIIKKLKKYGNEIQGSHMWTGGTRGLGGHTWTGGPHVDWGATRGLGGHVDWGGVQFRWPKATSPPQELEGRGA